MAKKPMPWTEPRVATPAGAILLKQPLGRLDFRIVDRVGFGSMRGGDFAHVIDVGVANGTFDLYARCPSAFLDLFEPHPSHHVTIERDILGARGAAASDRARQRERHSQALRRRGELVALSD
jgi:hypothetical protein